MIVTASEKFAKAYLRELERDGIAASCEVYEQATGKFNAPAVVVMVIPLGGSLERFTSLFASFTAQLIAEDYLQVNEEEQTELDAMVPCGNTGPNSA